MPIALSMYNKFIPLSIRSAYVLLCLRLCSWNDLIHLLNWQARLLSAITRVRMWARKHELKGIYKSYLYGLQLFLKIWERWEWVDGDIVRAFTQLSPWNGEHSWVHTDDSDIHNWHSQLSFWNEAMKSYSYDFLKHNLVAALYSGIARIAFPFSGSKISLQCFFSINCNRSTVLQIKLQSWKLWQ